MPSLTHAKKMLFLLISIDFLILFFYFFPFHRNTIPFFGFFSISANSTNILSNNTYLKLKITPTISAKLTTLGSLNYELDESNENKIKKECPMIPDNLGAYF